MTASPDSAPLQTASPVDWIARVRSAERSGNYLVAHDLATKGLAEHPADVSLRYLATRTLARTGAFGQAAAMYARFGLAEEDDADMAALGARLKKDAALATQGERRAQALCEAAQAYGAVDARWPGHYPAVNAATLFLLAGDRVQAQSYAQTALAATSQDTGPGDLYYRCASRAEAALICGDTAIAAQALREAAQNLGGNYDAAAATRRQLRLACAALGQDEALLAPLRPPSVVHYCATLRIIGGDAPDKATPAKLSAWLSCHGIGYAYGSLGPGEEITFAEVCLKAGIELNVVLPFGAQEFARSMVAPAGEAWVTRFEACLAAAASLTLASPDAHQGDHSLFSYASGLAMGTAVLRAGHLDTSALHLRLQAGGWEPDAPGYAANLALWHAKGFAAEVLTLDELPPAPAPAKVLDGARPPPRFARALVFGDVKGFSKTPDHLVPAFQTHMMGAIASVLRSYGGEVLYRNSWGDAIYVVFENPVLAAHCCMAVQDAVKQADVERYGLPTGMSLRLSAHFGPVYAGHDPIRDEPAFYGANTTLAARIEPVTPPGNVYLTEPMAAAIALAAEPGLVAEYVGNVPMAKGFGSTRMYCLRAISA